MSPGRADASTLRKLVLTGFALDPGLSSGRAFHETVRRYEDVGYRLRRPLATEVRTFCRRDGALRRNLLQLKGRPGSGHGPALPSNSLAVQVDVATKVHGDAQLCESGSLGDKGPVGLFGVGA